MSWASLRVEVFRRDRGRCQVCLCKVGHRWDAGHLVDRCVGGSDTLGNLVLMCRRCNHTKPVHAYRADALAWLAERRQAARTGREIASGWWPFLRAMYSR